MVTVIVLTIIFAIILAVVVGLLVRDHTSSGDILVSIATIVAVWACVVGVVAPFSIRVEGGLLRGYSDGVREGYITKISEKGLVWKTFEGEYQVGTGNMSAIQPPMQFSIPREAADLIKSANDNMGKKVRIKYLEWYWMPFKIGDSGYELISIELVP